MGELQVTVIRHWIPHVISALPLSIPRKITPRLDMSLQLSSVENSTTWFPMLPILQRLLLASTKFHHFFSNFIPRPPGVVLQGISGGRVSVSTLDSANMLGTRCWHGDIPQGGADRGQGAAAIATDSGHGCGKLQWKPCSTILGGMKWDEPSYI